MIETVIAICITCTGIKWLVLLIVLIIDGMEKDISDRMLTKNHIIVLILPFPFACLYRGKIIFKAIISAWKTGWGK